MNLQDAIHRHPNLMNNYRRAALALILATDMAERNEFGPRRDRYLFKHAFYIGTAQGWLHRHYGITLNGYDLVHELAQRWYKYGGEIRY